MSLSLAERKPKFQGNQLDVSQTKSVIFNCKDCLLVSGLNWTQRSRKTAGCISNKGKVLSLHVFSFCPWLKVSPTFKKFSRTHLKQVQVFSTTKIVACLKMNLTFRKPAGCVSKKVRVFHCKHCRFISGSKWN